MKSSGRAKRTGCNLNVGCGHYEIDGFVSLDFYSDHYYLNYKFKRVHYDMRKDNLPYQDESVDAIYCSHVIEHIETNFVEKFFLKSYRTLKLGGVMRIACPDPYFLFKKLKEVPQYFFWHPLYKKLEDAETCFIAIVAAHRYKLDNFGLKKKLNEYNYNELLEEIIIGGEFDKTDPGRHINAWDFNRIKVLGTNVGFSRIVKSRCKASIKPSMQGDDIDLSHPVMSLYVDLLKS